MEGSKETGLVCAFIAQRGFGFISQGSGRTFKKFFFHISQIVSGEPVVGATALFNVSPVTEGPNPTAIEVEIATGGDN